MKNEKENPELTKLLKKFKNICKLNKLAKLAYKEAKRNGFHEENDIPKISEYCSNLHGEISELWEAYRKSQLDEPCDKKEKLKENNLPILTSFEEELADIVIRAMDTAGTFKINIMRAVFVKMIFNRTRGFRNGGKLA